MRKDELNEFYENYEIDLMKESEKLDRILFVLAAGAFVISVTFLTGLREVYFDDLKGLLITWAMFALAIVLIILKYTIHIHFRRFVIRNNSKYYSRIIAFLVGASTMLIVVGLFSLTLFASKNMIRINSINKEKQEMIIGTTQ